MNYVIPRTSDKALHGKDDEISMLSKTKQNQSHPNQGLLLGILEVMLVGFIR